MRNCKVDLNLVIFKITLLIPISTLIQGLPFLSNINRILIAILLVLLSFVIIKKRKNKMSWIMLVFFVFLMGWSLIITNKFMSNFNILFYFPTWVLLLIYMKENYEKLISFISTDLGFIKKVIILWSIIVFGSLFLSSSYSYTWGEGKYFISFTNGEHRFASTAILMITLELLIFFKTNKKKYLLISILPIITIYMSGARTYLALLAIILYCFLYTRIKNKFLLAISSVFLLLSLYSLIKITSIGDKMKSLNNSIEYLGVLGALTSGRTNFWSVQLSSFFGLNLIFIVFGAGFTYIYEVSGLWAHNDVISVLLNFGFVGIIVYFYPYISLINFMNKKNKLPNILLFCSIIIWFFNAMFNMVYTYICAIIMIPFLHQALFIGQAKILNSKKR